jgi:hypothetical protein
LTEGEVDDPFFVDTTREPCPVLFARHGAGTWSPIEIASPVESFVTALVEFERVLLVDFGKEVFDDDGLIPEFVQSVEQRVGTVLTTDQTARFVRLKVVIDYRRHRVWAPPLEARDLLRMGQLEFLD